MIPVRLIDDLAAFVEEANRNFRASEPNIEDQALKVSAGYLKEREEDETEYNFLPCVVVRLIAGEDTQEGSTARVRLYFGTYCEDAAGGWRELFNLMEHTRQALLRTRTIANRHRLLLPTQWEIPEEQPFPVYVGYMEMSFQIAQPREEIL